MKLHIRARLRLLFGVCPECNSDAPNVDNCMVCDGYRTPYPPSADTKARWWRNFREGGLRLKNGKAQARELGALASQQRRDRTRYW